MDNKERKRYYLIDVIRGFTLLNMIAYHTIYDIEMIYNKSFDWYDGQFGYIWQQVICWTFILISGMCRAIGRKSLKRGLIVSGCGIIITVATMLVLPDEPIYFGILTFMGAAMLILIPFEKISPKINSFAGLGVSALLFVLTRNINDGYLGFEGWKICKVPDFMYQNYVTAFFGFPQEGFVSSDYFSIFPWIFLYLCGFFAWKCVEKREKILSVLKVRVYGFDFLGKQSLWVYMMHQVIVFAIVYLSYIIIF